MSDVDRIAMPMDDWVSVLLAGASLSMKQISGNPHQCRDLAVNHGKLFEALVQAMESIEMALGIVEPDGDAIQ